jgi:hypothetical protein
MRQVFLPSHELVTELLSLPLEFGLQPFVALGVSLRPKRSIVFDLIFDHRVENDSDLPCRCGDRPGWPQLGFHAAQIVTQWRVSVMQRIGRQPEHLPGAVVPFRIPFHSTRPANIVSGHSSNQEAKCPALGHRRMSLPTSLKSGNGKVSSPGICVTSTPNSL